MRIMNIARRGGLALLLLLAGNAWAQANLEVNAPAVAALQSSMQKRFAGLQPLYANGAVGLTRDGFVALRDANAVPLAQRQQVNGLVAAEKAADKIIDEVWQLKKPGEPAAPSPNPPQSR